MAAWLGGLGQSSAPGGAEYKLHVLMAEAGRRRREGEESATPKKMLPSEFLTFLHAIKKKKKETKPN